MLYKHPRLKKMYVESIFVLLQMVSYDGQLTVYLEELMDLTVRVAIMDTNPEDYVKLDFELLRTELREFEALVSQLRDSLNSTSPLFDSLFTEVSSFHPVALQSSSLVTPQCHFPDCTLDPQHDRHREPTGDH